MRYGEVTRVTNCCNLQTKHCCFASWKALIARIYHPHQKLSHIKISLLQVDAGCCMFQLATKHFFAWQCLKWVVIRPTTLSTCNATLSWTKMLPVLSRSFRKKRKLFFNYRKDFTWNFWPRIPHIGSTPTFFSLVYISVHIWLKVRFYFCI